ncbi:MAG: heme o synthase [Rhodobacteraceae bacterium]|nr:heme o synthase [Paracoccaceae bacterium]MCY4196685.1 heme o synthase [Paracoccaceae bacterium]
MTDKSLQSAALQNRTIAGFDDIMVLLKPRVMSLAVFTSAVAMVIAPGPLHPVIALASILYIAIGAGAAGALNMWWDCDIDYQMRRTRSRPVPGKRLDRQDAFQIGMWLSGFSVVMLALTANLLAGLLLALTIFYYVVVYTIFLKRRTSQNIVIGGAAGALPPVIGWAVSAGSMPLEAWLLFLIIFLWTPPHFWALALYSADDYRRAGVPVLNITHGDRATRRQILLYSLSLAPVSAVIAVSSVGGPVFAVAAIVMNGEFLRRVWLLWRREQEVAKTDRFLVERKFFRFSLFYLFVLFLALAADKVLLMATGIHFLTSGSI